MEPEALSALGVFRLKSKPVSTGRAAGRPAFPLGLGESGVHEVCEAEFGDMAALTGFALVARKNRRGAVFWVSQSGLGMDHGGLYTSGLGQVVAAPPAIISARPHRLADTLWVIEEAIASRAVGLVVAELSDADFTASRRLALASGRFGVPVILLMPYTRQGATAATARWRVCAQASAPNRFDAHAPGNPRWRAVLERARQAPHMAGQSFNLELDDETLSLIVVPGLATHAPAPRQTGSKDRLALSRLRIAG